MPEQPLSDPFEVYATLFERRNQLVALQQSAVDDTVGKSVQSGIDIVDSKLEQLAQDPSFAEQVFARLDQTAIALGQLNSLQDVLPADQLTETKIPYEATARAGFGIAANLRLDQAGAERLRGLQAMLGTLSINAEVEIASRQDVADTPQTKPVTAEVAAKDDVSSEELQKFLDGYFSKVDALILVQFLATANELIRAHQVPALDAETIQSIVEHLSDDKTAMEGAQLDVESLKRARAEVVSRIEDFLEDEELLGKLLDCLPKEDPRLTLIDYFYMTLNEVTRKSLSRLAEVNLESAMGTASLEPKTTSSVKSSESQDTRLGAVALAADSSAAPQEVLGDILPGVSAEEIAAQQELINKCTTQIALLRQKFNRTTLKRGEEYTLRQLSEGLKLPLARTASALVAAKKANLLTASDKEDEASDKMNISTFIKILLHADPELRDLVKRCGKEVEALIKNHMDPNRK